MRIRITTDWHCRLADCLVPGNVNCRLVSIVILLSGFVVAGLGGSTVSAQDSPAFDGITPYTASSQSGYRKCWALLIGINYTGRQDEVGRDPANARALPRLNNAANDARALATVLKTYYHYDDSSVTLLTDEGPVDSLPTAARIREEINRLCDPGLVHADDSVLIFFAGHGFKLDQESALGGNAVYLLPYDVQLSRGQPTGLKRIGVPDELFRMVQEIPATHKLMVLDCCYSGEIFNAQGAHSFQSRGEAANRSDTILQKEPAFQAMASCRARQLASDGRGGNSRFTAALLDGLKYIPARSDGDRRVWANRLLAYMQSEFDEFQRPDCRDLIGSTGEFCLFPREPELFAGFVLQAEDQSHLKAMVVSLQGNWWFEEMPWFIPGIRSEIVRKHEQAQTARRSATFSDLLEFEQLRKAAEELLVEKRLEQRKTGADDALAEMRFEHAHALIAVRDAKQLEATLQRIESDLSGCLTPDSETLPGARGSNPPVQPVTGMANHLQLEPEDLHLLAVVQHAMGRKEDAGNSYRRALASYARVSAKDQERLRPSAHILEALCRADFGEFLLQEQQDPRRAVEEFSRSRKDIRALLKEKAGRAEDSAAFFRIFLLCREAKAWMSLNHTSQANRLLDEARNISEALAPNHFLQAHVLRRSAWAQIVQWNIKAAKASFRRANEILDEQFRRESSRRGDPVSPLIVAADQPGPAPPLGSGVEFHTPQTASPTGLKSTGLKSNSTLPQSHLGPQFRNSSEHALKIAYLHNLHGIAMALRFEGDTRGAAGFYRWLYGEVEDAYSRFRDSSSDADLEQQFILRLINTQERLGDCNLFGDPEVRDLGEAVDDYHRAAAYVHRLRGAERDQLHALLLYKRALALSLPSPVRNTRLALQMCGRAEVIYETQQDKATGPWQAIGQLAPKVVRCLAATTGQSAEVPGESASGCDAVCGLRAEIERYRDAIKASPRRDQLEMCLFAARVLLEHGGPRDTYQLLTDADLLLSFCRIGLKPHVIAQTWDVHAAENRQSESQAYLRAYYDSVMRAHLANSSPNIKDLLAIQAEATSGAVYVKLDAPVPILATYVLGDKCLLLLDLPHAEGKCLSVAEMYDVEAIRRASESTTLPLPREIARTLTAWRSLPENSTVVQIDLRWEDPVRDFPAARETISEPDALTTTARRIRACQFPFTLPTDFSEVQPATARIP